jgi:hypothetical protein
MLMLALIPQWLYLLLITPDRNSPEKRLHQLFTQMGKKQMYLPLANYVERLLLVVLLPGSLEVMPHEVKLLTIT